jgi:hypothetical protein
MRLNLIVARQFFRAPIEGVIVIASGTRVATELVVPDSEQ